MTYPALEVAGVDADLVLAIVDDYAPTAAEQYDTGVTVFFTSTPLRDSAHSAVARAFPGAATRTLEIDDEDWARRSQQNLPPVTVGRIVITSVPPDPNPPDLPIVVVPSMGFGTGHHATTRLCLSALQTLALNERTVLDIGTGSGVLAMAARLLGAERATGIDVDADAVHAALENLERNPSLDRVAFLVADLRAADLSPADVVMANLTGALLVATAQRLLALVRPGGTLIVSGLLEEERDGVAGALGTSRLTWEATEDGWVGMAFNRGATIEV